MDHRSREYKSCQIVIILLLFVVNPVKSQTIVSPNEVKETGLYTVEITTEQNEEPKGTIIESPRQAGSYNIIYDNKVPCQIIISKDNNTIYDSGPYQNKVSGATIRINGNTTAYYSDPLNMPYKLKLEQEADLLSRGNDEIYREKHWRLLKDAVSLNTIVGLKLSQLIDMEWTAAYIPCNVIINGDYRGCYLLMETVRRNNKCRIHCDKQTGYIIERDPYWWKEQKYFSSSKYHDESMYRWTWKFPDEEDLDEIKEQYIQDYINAMEQSLYDGNYANFIDIVSWGKWILIHDILGTRDSGGANMYFKKYDNTPNSCLEMPCVWDFDSSYEVSPGDFSRLHLSANSYFSTLFNSSDDTFRQEYVNLWNQFGDSMISELMQFIDNYPLSDEAKAMNESRKLNNKRWNTNYNTVEEDVRKTLSWLEKHIPLLKEKILSIEEKLSYIKRIDPDEITNQQLYNLNGIKVERNKARRGIYISKGRKYTN